MSADAKDQIFESKILMQLLHKIGALKGEIAQKDQLLEAANKVSSVLIEDSEKSMETIYRLRKEIRNMKKEMELEKKTHLKVKKELYDDFQVEIKKTAAKYRKFKGLSALELKVNQSIVDLSQSNMIKMETELKMLKTCLQVPKLREQLKNHNFKELDFTGFLKEMDQLTFNVKAELVKQGCIAETKEFKMEQAEQEQRTKFKLNQTFNMT